MRHILNYDEDYFVLGNNEMCYVRKSYDTMHAMERFARQFLYVTVFLTGAAVLVIEVTAVRILSPHFGSSLYVLSSVLTVILGALSVGYYIGGKLSDRRPDHEPLYAIIAISGVTVLMSEYLAIIALPLVGGVFSVISGPLLLGIAFFFVPAFLLGTISPYIIKLQSVHTPSNEIGSVVGATFFWGTVGSITGSLLTGFVLVPFFGVTASVVGTALCLVMLGISGFSIKNLFPIDSEVPRARFIHQKQHFILTILVVATIFFVLIKITIPNQTHSVVYQTDGHYSKLLVYEVDRLGHIIRVLKQDTNNSSAVDLDSYDLVFGYTQFAEFYSKLKPHTTNFLMIGGGSYGIPRTLVARNPDIQITVSELEPVLPELAEKYFDVRDMSRIDTKFTDGRVLLARSTTTYDVIFGDAFGTDLSIPAHLATREFFLEVKKDLTDEGIFMLNYIGTLSGEVPTLTGSLVKTLKSIFPNIKMYAFNKDTPTVRQNIMFVARNGDTPIHLDGESVKGTDGKLLTLHEMEVPVSQFERVGEYMLTDDRAPIEYLMLAQQR